MWKPTDIFSLEDGLSFHGARERTAEKLCLLLPSTFMPSHYVLFLIASTQANVVFICEATSQRIPSMKADEQWRFNGFYMISTIAFDGSV